MIKIKNFISSINLSGVRTGAWIRAIMMLISIIFYVLKVFGITPPEIDESAVINAVMAVFGIIAFLQGYWKNNSFSEAAQQADKIMIEKKGEI